jgi:hypothetical protein
MEPKSSAAVRVLSLQLKDDLTNQSIWFGFVQYEANNRVHLGDQAHVTDVSGTTQRIDLTQAIGVTEKLHLQTCIRSLLKAMYRVEASND